MCRGLLKHFKLKQVLALNGQACAKQQRLPLVASSFSRSSQAECHGPDDPPMMYPCGVLGIAQGITPCDTNIRLDITSDDMHAKHHANTL